MQFQATLNDGRKVTLGAAANVISLFEGLIGVFAFALDGVTVASVEAVRLRGDHNWKSVSFSFVSFVRHTKKKFKIDGNAQSVIV